MKANDRISRIEVYKASLQLAEPFRTSLAEITEAQNIFVRVHTASGLYGTGEARPNPPVTGETQETAYAAAAVIGEVILNAQPFNLEEINRRIERRLVKNSAAKSAVNMALYDLLGKLHELPLYALLGGGKRPIFTDNTVSIAPAEEMRKKAMAIREDGFRAIKVKLGGAPAEDIERMRVIRESVGPDIALRLDANQGWNCKDAIRILRELEQYDIQYCEQPLPYWDLSGMQRVSRASAIPVMADESLFGPHDAFDLAARGICDYFNIKLTKAGGISNGLAINSIAESAGIPCMIGCMTESRLAMSAGAHLMSARSNIQYADLDGYTSMKEDPVTGGVRYERGDMQLPDDPGHGADLDPAFLADCSCRVVE